MVKVSRILVGVCLFALAATTSSAWGADKNGVSPESISLPSGPGSIEGLGESFQPLLSTGTAAYGVPFELPSGVAGHTPSLSLSYNSGFSNGVAGRGWMIGPGAISRQTDKGIPRYVDGANSVDDDADGETDELDEVDRILGPDGEDLVLVSGDIYRARLEGGFARFRRLANSWEVTLKDGTRLLYGTSSEFRVADASGNRVFKWLLERSTDTNGNVIEYRYSTLPGSDNQKYLTEIRYGPGASPWSTYYFVALNYASRQDWTTDYRSGFLVKTAHRLTQVDVGIQGATPAQLLEGDWNNDGTPDSLIRRYTMAYDGHSHWSFLSRLTQFGSDGQSYLPPISFEYQVFDPPATSSAAGSVIGSSGEPVNVMDRDQVELVDLNADGLPDLLQTTVGNHVAYINGGAVASGGSTIAWQGPTDAPSDDGLSALLSLASNQVHLADMDGDGLSDLIQTTVNDDVLYFSNKGASAFGARQFMSIQDTAPPAPFNNAEVRTADLNFDKNIDIVRSSEQGYSTWYNFGDGRYSREMRTAGASYQGQTLRFSATGVQLADMNGDRLSDVVRIRPTGVVYSASMGQGAFTDGVLIPIPDQVLSDGAGGQVERAKLSDISGDGLADLVLERADNGELWYWLNLGNNTFSSKYVVTGMPMFFGVDAVTRWADLNGNGTNDLIYADSTATPRLQTVDIGEIVGGTANANSLTKIDNGLGVVTSISYRSSSQLSADAQEAGSPWEITLPFPVSVVTKVEVRTGLDIDGVPGDDVYVTDYNYRDGYYDFREKEFRGFREVIVTDIGDSSAPTLVTRHLFHTGEPDGIDNDADTEIDEISALGFWEEEALKGKPLAREAMTTEGFLFNRDEMDWRIKTLLTGQDTSEVRFAELGENRSLIYEGTATPETIRTTLEYDIYGNVINEQRFGSLSIDGDERFTTTEFIHDTDRWILDRPQRVLETDSAGIKVAESLSYYDGEDYVGLALGALERGNLVRQQGWVANSEYINLVRSAYDPFGNVVGLRDGNGNLREVQYDTSVQTFPINETVHVGGGSAPLTMSADYNIGLGVMNRSTDFNGNSTDYVHDGFARPVATVRPGDTPAQPTQQYVYTLVDPENDFQYQYDAAGALVLSGTAALASSVKVRARETSGEIGTLDTINYVDGLGRGLATVTEGETGFVVTDAVLFNDRASVRVTLQPYRAANNAYAVPQAGDRTELEYDATGREVRRINPPDANGIVTDVLTSYLPLRKSVSDELRNTMHYDTDGLGRMVRVVEVNEGEEYLTRYTYNAIDSLTQIDDAQDNRIVVQFDGLQRRTFMNHPDRGVMSYIYDEASNLIEKTDAKSQRTIYTYDGANRLLTEDYKDEGLPFSANLIPDVAYHYDDSAGLIDRGDGTSGIATNAKGQLAWVQDLSGEEHLSYDDRGRVVWRVKKILDPSNASLASFRTSMSYDSLDRMTELVYPDNDRIGYQYNARGLPESIGGGSAKVIVSDIDYRASGQTEYTVYGNGVESSYGYDPRLRLTGLNTVSVGSAPSSLIDFSYTYDGASNITVIGDGRPQSQIPNGDTRRNTQVFTYDDLYRLKSVEYPAIGRIDFGYDRIGNMLSKTSNIVDTEGGKSVTNLGSMAYGDNAGRSNRIGRGAADPPGPHALTSSDNGAAQREFEYDANGNMTSNDGMLMTWDYKDRLVSVETSDADAAYKYDYSDRRVSKHVMPKPAVSGSATFPKKTLYIDRYFEIRDNEQPTKYVLNGETRVAKVTGTLNPATERVQFFQLQEGWNLLSLAVDAGDAAGQFGIGANGAIEDVYRWDSLVGEYVAVGQSDSLPVGSVFWVFANEVQSSRVRGVYDEPQAIIIPDGFSPVGLPWIDSHPMQDLLDSGLSEIWIFDAESQNWRARLSGENEFLSDAPDHTRSGHASFFKATSSLELERPDTYSDIRFYHQDHLGSSSVITDNIGSSVEEVAYYPFGNPRSRYSMSSDLAVEPYRFTQKELDAESGLQYFEARYYLGGVGRFASVDPILEYIPDRIRGIPQMLGSYSYSINNPINLTDPTGRETVGELIERNAIAAFSEGNDVGGLALTGASALWSVFGAENVSKVFDPSKNTSTTTKVLAAMEVVLPFVPVTKLASTPIRKSLQRGIKVAESESVSLLKASRAKVRQPNPSSIEMRNYDALVDLRDAKKTLAHSRRLRNQKTVLENSSTDNVVKNRLQDATKRGLPQAEDSTDGEEE